MYICDITNFYSPKSGGVKTYINHKRDYITKNHDLYKHLLIVPGAEDSFQRNGCCDTAYVAGPEVKWESNYRFITNLTRITDLVNEYRPDIIEMGSMYLVPWAVRRISKHFSIPLVGFFHSNFPDTYVYKYMSKFHEKLGLFCQSASWKYAKLVYGMCDAVIATSRHSETRLSQAGIKNVRRIPFGVNNHLFDPANFAPDTRQNLGFSEDRCVLLYVGRLSNEKDLKSLLAAFDILQEQHPDTFALAIAGSGPLKDIVEAKASSCKDFIYLGYRSSDEGLPELYASADIFVTPSPNETFGLSPLEAISAGLPVVAVKGGAVSETIPEYARIIGEPYCPESLAESIFQMKSRLTAELKIKTREYTVNNYSWDCTFKRIFSLYEELVEKKKHVAKKR